MYNPQRYKSDNVDDAFELMDKYPFATMVSVVAGKPFISHVPLTPKKSADGIEIIGHVARANPHWQHFKTAETTVVFQGPHTYITPKWYAQNNVPTWDYSALHVSGSFELIESHDGILKCLKELTTHVERYWPSGWEFYIPDDLADPNDLVKSIVAFKLNVTDLNFKKKLHQKSTPADRAGVLRGLEGRRDDNSRAVLQDMLKMYDSNGEFKKN